jgi:hypothetical protein
MRQLPPTYIYSLSVLTYSDLSDLHNVNVSVTLSTQYDSVITVSIQSFSRLRELVSISRRMRHVCLAAASMDEAERPLKRSRLGRK